MLMQAYPTEERINNCHGTGAGLDGLSGFTSRSFVASAIGAHGLQVPNETEPVKFLLGGISIIEIIIIRCRGLLCYGRVKR